MGAVWEPCMYLCVAGLREWNPIWYHQPPSNYHHMTIRSPPQSATAHVTRTPPPEQMSIALMQSPRLLTAHMFPVTDVILV